MTWVDMGLYWAWRGNGECSQPPTKKRIEYADILMPNKTVTRLAVTVYDDNVGKQVNRDELAWLISNGGVLQHQVAL